MESNNTIRSSREEMFALIEKYLDSSQSRKQFCIDNTIKGCLNKQLYLNGYK